MAFEACHLSTHQFSMLRVLNRQLYGNMHSPKCLSLQDSELESTSPVDREEQEGPGLPCHRNQLHHKGLTPPKQTSMLFGKRAGEGLGTIPFEKGSLTSSRGVTCSWLFCSTSTPRDIFNARTCHSRNSRSSPSSSRCEKLCLN